MTTAELADLLEERDNFRKFAATLPTIEECRFSCHYIPFRMGAIEGDSTCEILRKGARYEGVGSSDAAAYGRMISAICEREA